MQSELRLKAIICTLYWLLLLGLLHHLVDVFHVLHVTHVLPPYSMFSHPGWQDASISAALIS